MPDAFFYEEGISWLFPSLPLWLLFSEFDFTLKSAKKGASQLDF